MNNIYPGSQKLKKLFYQVIDTYHLKDDINTSMPDWGSLDQLEMLLSKKCWVDTVQWHLEDVIRDPNIEPDEALKIKRKIDASNQVRTNLVEQLDDSLLAPFQENPHDQTLPINTESPAWAIDRLSILALKIYHMREESVREDGSVDHRLKCQQKLDVLLDQEQDLSAALDQLMEDLYTGKRRVKIYRQMKMYNDQDLNPVLYKKEA